MRRAVNLAIGATAVAASVALLGIAIVLDRAIWLVEKMEDPR